VKGIVDGIKKIVEIVDFGSSMFVVVSSVVVVMLSSIKW